MIEAGLPTEVPPLSGLSLVSQTDVARFIQSSLSGDVDTGLPKELLEPLMEIKVSALSDFGGTRSTLAMLSTQSALHGFRTIYCDRLSGIPVINNEGQVYHS